MKVAWCLHGQARNYKTGFEFIQKIKDRHPDVSFDFYFHTWKIKPTERYDHSLWRSLSDEELTPNENMEKDLIEFFKPIKYEIEDAISFKSDKYVDTLMYKNTANDRAKQNIPNVLSQYYSRTKTHDIFQTTNIKYDFVIVSRFDLKKDITVNLYEIIPDKIYCSNIHSPRKILDDNFLVMSVEKYILLFNGIDDVVNNAHICQLVTAYNEEYAFGPEQILLSKILLYNHGVDNVIYSPNFLW